MGKRSSDAAEAGLVIRKHRAGEERKLGSDAHGRGRGAGISRLARDPAVCGDGDDSGRWGR